MIEFDYATLEKRLRELAFLNSGVRIVLTDDAPRRAQARGAVLRGRRRGLRALPRPLAQDRSTACRSPSWSGPSATASASRSPCGGTTATTRPCCRFTNNIPQRDGGTHLAGFRARADPPDHRLRRESSGIAKKREGPAHRRRLPRGPDRRRLGARCRTRSSPRRPRTSSSPPRCARRSRTWSTRASRTGSRRTRPRPASVDRQGDRWRPPPARRRARPARPDPQGRARHRLPARQARRLPGARPVEVRDPAGRGRFRRRLGQAGPRPRLPGGAAAARQDPQRRAGARSTGCCPRAEIGTLITALGAGIGRVDGPRGLQPRQAALPPHHHHDGRRRGRLAHPHPAADVLLPADAGADRARPPLHRPAAALQSRPRQVARSTSRTSGRWRTTSSTPGIDGAVLRLASGLEFGGAAAARPWSRRRARARRSDAGAPHPLRPRRRRAGR